MQAVIAFGSEFGASRGHAFDTLCDGRTLGYPMLRVISHARREPIAESPRSGRCRCRLSRIQRAEALINEAHQGLEQHSTVRPELENLSGAGCMLSR